MPPVRSDLLTESDVTEKRFPVVRFREGYDRRDVDAFLVLVAAEFAARWAALRTSRSAYVMGRVPLGAQDVVNSVFNATKLREGYDQDAVDDFLDEVVHSLKGFDALGIAAGGAYRGAEPVGDALHWKRPHRFEAEDAWLTGQIAGHFAANNTKAGRPGVDAGAGRSLHAALLLLPWCRSIDLVETDPGDLEWLNHQALETYRGVPGSEFVKDAWRNLRTAAGYASIEEPLSALQGRLLPQSRRLVDLPRTAYGMGTMLFPVSLQTWSEAGFTADVSAFLASLEPGAPYALAFVTGSTTLPEPLLAPALARLTRAGLLSCPVSQPEHKGGPADARILLALGTA